MTLEHNENPGQILYLKLAFIKTSHDSNALNTITDQHLSDWHITVGHFNRSSTKKDLQSKISYLKHFEEMLNTKVKNMGGPASVGKVELNTFTVRIVRTDNENAKYYTYKTFPPPPPAKDPCPKSRGGHR